MTARGKPTGPAWIGFLVLVVLHLDAWRTQRPTIHFGWLPEDIAYRLVWMAAATVYLWWFCARVWAPEDEGPPARTPEDEP